MSLHTLDIYPNFLISLLKFIIYIYTYIISIYFFGYLSLFFIDFDFEY